MPFNLLLVAIGGAFGSCARYLLGVAGTRVLGTGFPYGTFAANLTGGLLMGLLVSYLALRGGADQERLRVLLAVGVLGGFTTFSSFSLETALMIERRAYLQAGAYATGSAVLAIAAVFLGMMIMRRVLA